MATDYNSLVADIGHWLARDDLVSRIPTFIQMAEDRHASAPEEDGSGGVRLRSQLQRDRAFGLNSVFLALPERYLEMEVVRFVNSRQELVMAATPALFVVGQPIDVNNSLAGDDPFYYSIHEELEFGAPITDTTQVEMIYYARYDRVEPAFPSNPLIENAYGLYLYGSLVMAQEFLVGDERIEVWERAYRRQCLAAQKADKRSRHSAAPRVTLRYGGLSTP